MAECDKLIVPANSGRSGPVNWSITMKHQSRRWGKRRSIKKSSISIPWWITSLNSTDAGTELEPSGEQMNEKPHLNGKKDPNDHISAHLHSQPV